MFRFIKKIVFFILISVSNKFYCQEFLNGSFENNFASNDLINLNTFTFNSSMTNCYSFGLNSNLDIITSSTYAGGSQNGKWFVAMTGGGSDQLGMELTAPLTMGDEYIISFYDKADTIGVPAFIEIGLSSTINNFGTLIYSTSSLATIGQWTQRVFSFTSPLTAQFITIRQLGTFEDNWVQIDNFDLLCPYKEGTMNVTKCIDSNLVIGSMSIVDANIINYNWYYQNILLDSISPTISISSNENTLYIQEIQMCGEIYRDSFYVNINTECNIENSGLIVPNVFSPNGDGINDVWKVELGNKELQSFVIYNRWGVEQKNSKTQTSNSIKVITWDGYTTSGIASSDGVYYYVLEVKNEKGEVEKYRGYITLLR